MDYDAASWGALAIALSLLGGIITWYRWKSGGLPTLLRGTAWSLLPLAAWLTGVLELVAGIAEDVGRWAARLVFSPSVWLGIVLAGVAVVLFGASAFVSRRRGDEPKKQRKQRKPRETGTAEEPRQVQPPRKGKQQPVEGLEDMDDIDAILKKHGIQ